ncbi:cysteine-rich receptor-like protein kinase 10-like protein [Corchorus olitorius]|uniref:Cysteine-rich receptor-like protein kinase 10-like protein n=1 Tax=Corchorus olitorius TaxID=93759 RepID=A0A1R3JP61_9ROSI|nr:cysteine-rich receptor-like protein kinase 10-like protein [Corchorus olitorius]
MELMDSTLRDSYMSNEVLRCIHIGLLCVQENRDARPTMARVALMLSSCSISLPSPQKIAFFFGTATATGHPPELLVVDKTTTTNTSSSATVNEVSITDLFP